MARSLWTLLLVALPAAGQEPQIPVRKLTISPAAAPVPALRYKLLPELRDTTPGNAALLYYRAFAPQWWGFYLRDAERLAEQFDDARSKPLAELRASKDEKIVWVRTTHMLKEVDRAARRAHCDWEMTQRVREEGISLLLPDVQSMRHFARMLAVRGRLELADGEYDKAGYTFQTALQMGRHVAAAPTLIQALVGVAITAVTLDQVEEWVGMPGSPNLYWALTNLPQPFIDLRTPYQGERLMLDNLLPGFREAVRDPNTRPMSAGQLRDVAEKLRQIERDAIPSWAVVAITAKKYGPAKEFLKARGWTAAQVEALPALQVVLIREAAEYDRLFDEMDKWQGLPYWVARPGLDRAEKLLKDEVVRGGAPATSLAAVLLPAVGKVQFASARTDRAIALLRVVEALRLHAAAHGGMPQTLAEVTGVPIPIDPVTGKPFEYTLAGETATLTAPPPAGEQPGEHNSRRYEITLKK